jgi:anti-anti-sigma factor
MYYKLASDQHPATRGLLEAVDAAAQKDDLALTVGLDEIPSLDAPAMNGLISALRRMRDAGGTVQLHVTRPDLIDTLAETGLDRVFKIVATPEEPRPKSRKRKVGPNGVVRNVAGGLAAAFIALLVLGAN